MNILDNKNLLKIVGLIAGALVLRKILNTKVAVVGKMSSEEDTTTTGTDTVKNVNQALDDSTIKTGAITYNDVLFNPVSGTSDVSSSITGQNGVEYPVYIVNDVKNLTNSPINTSPKPILSTQHQYSVATDYTGEYFG